MKEKDKRKTILKDRLYDIEVHDDLPSWEEFAHKRSAVYEKQRNSVTRRKLVLITRYVAAFLLLSGFVFSIYKFNSYKIKNNITVNSINTGTEYKETISTSDDSSRSSGNETSNIMEQNIAVKDSEELNTSNKPSSNHYPEIKATIDTAGDKIEILPSSVIEKNTAQASEISIMTSSDQKKIINSIGIYPIIESIYIIPSRVHIPTNRLEKINNIPVPNNQEIYPSHYLYDKYEYQSKWHYELSTDIQLINKYSFINDQSTESYNPKPPLTVNAGIYRNIGTRLTIGTGIGYESLRSTYLEFGVMTVTQTSIVAHYIGIPVILSYKITSNQTGANIYFTGNIYAEKLIRAKTIKDVFKYPSNMGSPFTTYLDHAGIMLSYSIGTGIEYNFTPKFGLYAEPYLNYYFYAEDQPLSVRTLSPISFNIRVGALFKK